jgi:hypothetical protein
LEKDTEPVSVFLKLKNPSSYNEVSEHDSFLSFTDKLLPAEIPVSLEIVIRLSEKAKPSWFARNSEQQKLRTALRTQLGNTESIALLRPNFLTVYSNLPGEYSSIVATAIELKWYSDTGNP